MANEEMKMYYRVMTFSFTKTSYAKYGGEVYAPHKPQPTRRQKREYVITETFYESKEECQKAIRTINRIL